MNYLALLLFSLLLGSGSVKVHTMQDDATGFSKYKTFCWLEGCEFTYTGPRYLDNSLWRETFKAAIIAELEGKSLVGMNILRICLSIFIFLCKMRPLLSIIILMTNMITTPSLKMK